MAPALAVPHSLRVGGEVTFVLGFGLSTLAVIMRIWTKARLTRTMLLEDYFSLAAWLSFLPYIGLAITIATNRGSPIHEAYLSVVESTIYCPIIVLVKVSILLQYITVFVVHRGNAFHIMVHVLLWTNVVFYTIDVLLVTFECKPRAKAWDNSIPGTCFSLHQLGISSGIINVISDFAILLLPLQKIWRLQMPWQKKWRILAVFAVGLFGCIAAVLRLVYSVQLTQVPANAFLKLALVTDKKGLWGFAEIALGIIAGCMPVLPRFFHQQVFINLSHGSWSGRGKSSSGGGRKSSERTLLQRVFGLSASSGGGRRRYPVGSTKVNGGSSGGKSAGMLGSKESKSVGGNSFQGIETQNLTRASMELSGTQFRKESSPDISLTALPLHSRDGQDPSLPALPGRTATDRDTRWLQMSKAERAELSIPGDRSTAG